jgi:uncharacterized protein (TIGR03086 family)
MAVDLEPITREVARLVGRVRDDQLDAPTPCTEMTVRDLLAHLVQFTIGFRMLAQKQPVSGGARPTGLPADWRALLPRVLDELADAWQLPAAWEGTVQLSGREMPGAMAGQIVTHELVLHGWDLARAIGAPYQADEPALRAAHDWVTATVERTGGKGQEGLFAPPVPVDDDAPLLDRVVALAGRTPTWTP